MYLFPTIEALKYARTIRLYLEEMNNEGADVEHLIEKLDGQIDKLDHILIYGDSSHHSAVRNALNSYKKIFKSFQKPIYNL